MFFLGNKNAKKTIAKKMKKEFHINDIDSSTFEKLECRMIKEIKATKYPINEMKIETEYVTKSLELDKVENLSLIEFSFLASSMALYTLIQQKAEPFITKWMVFLFLALLGIATFGSAILFNHRQEDLIYYKFTLECIKKMKPYKIIIRNKKSRVGRSKN